MVVPSAQHARSSELSPQRKRRRLRRKRSGHLKGCNMDTIPEDRTLHGRSPQSAPALLIPLLLMAATLAMNTGSSVDWKIDTAMLRGSIWNRDRRALITLTAEHVEQYPFNNFLDVKEEHKITDHVTGFYWQVPRSGGTTLKHIMGTCLRRVQAARTASDYCDMNSNELDTCQTKLGSFVNADPSDHGGIRRAENLKLVPSGIADVIVSSRILHAATLYDEEHKGRLFTILRDPIERSVSTFFYLQHAEWERNYRPEFKKMSILEYASLPDTAHNWMVRWLTGKNSEPELTRDDLDFAKELLRRKFLILLTDEMSSSVQRLMQYMHWTVEPQRFNETKQCLHENISKEHGHNKAKHPTPEKGSPEYNALRDINLLDIELYEFAKELFVEQWSTVYKGSGTKLNELFLEDYEDQESQERETNGKEESGQEHKEASPKPSSPVSSSIENLAAKNVTPQAEAHTGVNHTIGNSTNASPAEPETDIKNDGVENRRIPPNVTTPAEEPDQEISQGPMTGLESQSNKKSPPPKRESASALSGPSLNKVGPTFRRYEPHPGSGEPMVTVPPAASQAEASSAAANKGSETQNAAETAVARRTEESATLMSETPNR